MRDLMAAALPLLLAAAPAQGPKNENLRVPLPQGFKVGATSHPPGQSVIEFIPAAETVDSWSEIVTTQILYGRGHVDPDLLPSSMSKGWAASCPGGTSQKIGSSLVENGYPVALWMFVCTSNPKTGKPESMIMKVIGGSDSLYSVQYALRRTADRQMIPPVMAYLRRVLVCDARAAEHPCPTTRQTPPPSLPAAAAPS